MVLLFATYTLSLSIHRAMETAGLLDLPGAQWYTEIVLRERDKGLLDNVSWIERNEKFSGEMERRKRDWYVISQHAIFYAISCFPLLDDMII